MKRRISPQWLAWPLFALYRTWCATLRFDERNRARVDQLDSGGERLVFCLWHDELFPLMAMQRQLDVITLVSPSRDGEWLAVVLQKLGLRTARGSSGRGGAGALLNMAQLMRKEHVHACITVDGPKGPRHQAKEGALALARNAGAWVVPVRIFMHPALKFHSWDRFQVPLPFARVIIAYGQPWQYPEDQARARLEADLAALEGQNRQKAQEARP